MKESLQNRGVLGEVKARIRAEVFNALEDPSEPRPALSNENMIINELIREYLEFNKYKYTASVLRAGKCIKRIIVLYVYYGCVLSLVRQLSYYRIIVLRHFPN